MTDEELETSQKARLTNLYYVFAGAGSDDSMIFLNAPDIKALGLTTCKEKVERTICKVVAGDDKKPQIIEDIEETLAVRKEGRGYECNVGYVRKILKELMGGLVPPCREPDEVVPEPTTV